MSFNIAGLREQYEKDMKEQKDIEDFENGIKKDEEEIKSEADMFREMGLDPDSEFFGRDVKPEDLEAQNGIHTRIDFAEGIEKFKEAKTADEILNAAHDLYLNLKDISPETQKILDEKKRDPEDLSRCLENLFFYKKYELYNALMANFGVFRIGQNEKDMIEIQEVVSKKKKEPKVKKIQKKVG